MMYICFIKMHMYVHVCVQRSLIECSLLNFKEIKYKETKARLTAVLGLTMRTGRGKLPSLSAAHAVLSAGAFMSETPTRQSTGFGTGCHPLTKELSSQTASWRVMGNSPQGTGEPVTQHPEMLGSPWGCGGQSWP